MKNFINKYYLVIGFFAIVMMFLISILYAKIGIKGIKKNAKYTIGIMTSNWHPKNNNGVGTDFIYFVRGQKISKTGPYNLKIGKRCLIMYDSLKPSHCLMLGYHQLPDSIEAPYNGWAFKQVPIKLDSADLKAYLEKEGFE